jgi:hypothetical protein
VAYVGFCLVYVQKTLWGIKPVQLLPLAAGLIAIYRFLYYSAGCDSLRPVLTFFAGLLDSVLCCGHGLTLPFWFAPWRIRG